MGSHKVRIGKLPVPQLLVTRTGASVYFSWSLPRAYSRVSSYIVERGTNGTSFPDIVYTGTDTSYTTNQTFSDGVPLYYRVRYVDTSGRYSDYSASKYIINYAPVFTVAPTTASLGSSGGTIQFTAVDQQGETVQYSLTSKYRPDITIDQATGLVNVPSSAVGTSGAIVVQASDGILTSTHTCEVTVAATDNWNPAYPRTATYSISYFGNWNAARAYANSRVQLAIVGNFPNAVYGNGTYSNVTALGNAIKAYNANVKLLVYTIPTNVNFESASWEPFRTKLYAEKGSGGNGDWWLRLANGDLYVDSLYPNTREANHTRFVTRDAQGYTWPEWLARWHNTNWGSGPFDGVFQDVVWWDGDARDAKTADWNEDGVNDSKDSSTVENAMVEGVIDYVNAWRTIRPTRLVISNFIEVSKYPIPSSWQGQFDGGLQEHCCGKASYSVEEWGGWSTMMQWYRAALNACGGPKVAILHFAADYALTNWQRYQVGGSTESDAQLIYRVNRYGLCSALMDNGWYAFEGTYGDTDWLDEFGHSLGYPTQTPRTSAHALGVYLRQFENGCAIVNPKGNGQRTLSIAAGTLPTAGAGKRWDKIAGTQAPAINTGATNVTSVTINERDGLILKRVNA